MPHCFVRHLLPIALALLLGYSPSLVAQIDGEAEAPLVGEVEVDFRGLLNVSVDAVMVHVQIREGMAYDQNLVDRSIRSLYSTRLYETIEARVEELPDDRVKVIFQVQPKFRIGELRVLGNRKFSTRRLEETVQSKVNGVLDERAIRKDRDAIYEHYQKKGFTNVRVDSRIERDPITGFGTVRFIIDEGGKLKIKSVAFVGNEAIKAKTLAKKIKTKDWGPLSVLTASGRFNEVTFQEDLDKLRDFYRDEGYLDISIKDSDVILDYPTAKSIAITINLAEGRQYFVGDVSITGNKLFLANDLMRLLRLRSGAVFSPAKLDEDRTALVDFYGLIGYLGTFVRAERKPNLATGDIDLNHIIEEGERVFVESIIIEGNTKTKSVVILRELALAPGDVFNLVRMKNSQARLENTRFFEAETVNLTPEVTDIPGRRNLKISLREGRTGQFQFGAGFSSLEQGVFFAELSQSNFDLFNWRSIFQGDGQKFRLRFSIGSRSSDFMLHFEEPWLFEKELAVGFQFFRTETDFVSALYDELRTGIEVYLRKRLIGLWVARLSYRWEIVDILNVSPGAPAVLRDFEGTRSVSKIGVNLIRDTRNHLLWPTRGSRIAVNTQFAGLGGDTDYVRLLGRYAKFIPTLDFGEQVLAFIGSFGVVYDTSSDGRGLPFFDRFFLGGPNDLRGFEFRDVGPKNEVIQGGEPVGGNTMGFMSVEYTFKVADALRLAVFYDWGFINAGSSDFSFDDYNSNWGFGIRLMILNNPLRLDYGIPITTDEINNKGNQFNFSFGTRF